VTNSKYLDILNKKEMENAIAKEIRISKSKEKEASDPNE
jgi:hypothetical protein